MDLMNGMTITEQRKTTMRTSITRRSFLSSSAALGAIASGGMNARANDAAFNLDFTVPERSFLDQYYTRMLAIADGIRDTQPAVIAEAMERAYELKRNGGTVRSQVVYGHFAMFMGSPDLPGQPNVLPQSEDSSPTEEEYAALKAGDVLLTNCVNDQTLRAKERGVHVIGIINSYNKFDKTPPDGLRPERMLLSTGDVSNVVIDSQVPWDNGLIDVPQIPQLKPCPSTGTANSLVYWACTAAMATLIGTRGRGSAEDAARRYLAEACDRFRMIGTDRPKLDFVAERWADRVLGRGARLLVYGHPQDGKPYDGARNMFVNEAYIVASGTMIADQYENRADDLRPEDIVLIGAFTSDDPLEMSVARHGRETGAYTVSFGPYGTGGDTSGPRLFKEVDDAFSTYSEEREGFVPVKGFDAPVSPLTGVCGNMVHWMLTAAWTDHMCRRGEPPYFWKGFHENGGREYGEAAHPLFLERGY